MALRHGRSEAEHVVEAERAVAPEQPMIAEKPAGRVADDDIGAVAGARPSRRRRTSRDSARTASPSTGSRPLRARLRAPLASCRMRSVRALRVPRRRGRIDQMAERVVAAPSPRRRKSRVERPGGAAGIGLRLALVGQHGVEDMRAEAGLGGVAAGAVLVAEEPVQPAIAPRRLARNRRAARDGRSRRAARAVEQRRRDRSRPIRAARQPAEAAAAPPRCPTRS